MERSVLTPDAQAHQLVTEGFLTVPEVTAFLRVSRAKVYQMMDSGELAFCKFGKSRRVPKLALLELAQNSLKGQVCRS